MSLFETIEHKIEIGERITEADAIFLYKTSDLIRLSRLADKKNEMINQGQVFYNVNRHINPTNICVLSCKFCAFSRKPGDEGAYAYSIEEMVEKARSAVAEGATEVHMVGGLHPRWSFKHYLEMISSIKNTFPDLHIKAFTAVELDWFAKKTRTPIESVLKQLVTAGLGSMPGGGAEIFHPEIREQICDTKVPAEQWIETHKIAHGLGLKSNATMLYGHIENIEHRVDHMRRLRDLQDDTHGFNAFIPLSFQPHDNNMGINHYTLGVDDLRTVAVARLYLDNFKNVKTYWVMSGQDISQLALTYGANDLDGTVKEEIISHMAGGRSGRAMSRKGIEDLISHAQRIPIERDTLYNPINTPDQALIRTNDLSEILKKWTAETTLTNHEIAILLKHADLNLLSSLSQKKVAVTLPTDFISQPEQIPTSLEIPLNDAGNIIWNSLAENINKLDKDTTQNICIEHSGQISPCYLFKIISFLRSYVCKDISLELKNLLVTDGSIKGQAINQDPRFKTLVLTFVYGVTNIYSAIEKDSPIHDLLLDEMNLLLGEKPTTTIITKTNTAENNLNVQN